MTDDIMDHASSFEETFYQHKDGTFHRLAYLFMQVSVNDQLNNVK